MKKITRLLLVGIGLAVFSCNVEPVDNAIESESAADPVSVEDFESVYQDSLKSVEHRWRYGKVKKVATCQVFDADRCVEPGDPFEGASFWWPGEGKDFVQSFFENYDPYPLRFTKYADGTAQIFGMAKAVQGQSCKVFVNVWFKNKKNWEEWQAVGGELKDEGCSEAQAENLNYYVVDQRRSYIMACGSDCLGQGLYGFEQRPDPNDDGTPNFGIAVGPGGALWDSKIGKPGLAGWGWITNRLTGERLWDADFNFTFECEVKVVNKCKVENANRCSPNNPDTNFWWPEDSNVINFDDFFEVKEDVNYTFTEYDNGTARIQGSTVNINGLECTVDVDVWLKDRKNWEEWQAGGGELKDEGCSEAKAEDLHYYVIDSAKSVITANGGDCLGEGTYGASQRPDPNDPDTPNFGVAVGPGGALWDDRIGRSGLAGWLYITNKETGERLWDADFNFTMNCR